MADVDINLDEDLSDLLDRDLLQPQEAIALQNLRESQRIADVLAKKNEEPHRSNLNYRIRARK